jgi:plastocyanin
MPDRDVYLKIEPVLDYSPVDPEEKVAPPRQYRRDCMRNPGHEDTSIPLSEADARRLTALVYREYLDPSYLVPKPDKLVLADVNEPGFARRVPGTVIYASPGDRLRIHVFNADSMPHSLHMHGLRYGIDSDGSWPFGTETTDKRRSDEICSGQDWTYTFDVTNEMLGAWPFHDHSRHLAESINRGLFGGVVVLPRRRIQPPPVLELPLVAKTFLKELTKAKRPHPPVPDPGPLEPAMAGMAAMRMAPNAPMGRVDIEAEAVRMFLEEWSQLAYVHPKCRPRDVLHVPLFFHFMARGKGKPAFDSGPFLPGAAPFSVTFGVEGTFAYHCERHPDMHGKVTVLAGEASSQDVYIVDSAMPFSFNPPEVKVQPGGVVRWHAGTVEHTVTEDGAGLPSWCLNGRSFVGNTPTIEAEAGQRIRWYVFNLDLGMNWHNFHPHGQRWNFADEEIDIRSIGPAESFVVETTAPPVLALPPAIAKAQEGPHRGAKQYRLRGDFLVHCHVEMHMMQGLAGLVRSRQTLWLTQKQADELRATTGLPIDNGQNDCPDVDLDRCEELGCGSWQEVPGLPEVTFMHAALLPRTTRVLFWGYGDTRDDLSRVWDYSSPGGTLSLPANQPFDVTVPVHDRPLANIWSAEHAFLDNTAGTLLVHGGFTPRQSFLFDPPSRTWSRTAATAQDRFYSTTLTMPDGKVLTMYGSTSQSIEVYDPAAGTWSAPKPFPGTWNYIYYPWAYLLPGGDIFIAGHQGVTRRFDPAATPIVDDPMRTWSTVAGERSTGGEKGTSVLLPLRPPDYKPRVLNAGGDPLPAQQTSEWIDLSAPTPAWTALPNLNQPRPQQVNSVLLPDGRVFLAGGIDGVGGPTEIFDPQNPSAGWLLCSSMKYPRGYHSAAILLADGSVLMGGDRPGAWKSGETTPHERYYPSYYFMARPQMAGAPTTATYGSTFTVNSSDAASIGEVVLLRPGAVTHGFNMSQRLIECVIASRTASSLDVEAPPDGTVAPPGYYLLFVVTAGRIPSQARWIRIHA